MTSSANSSAGPSDASSGNPRPASGAVLQQRLEAAAAGLLYSSEADYPFEFFSLPAPGRQESLTPSRFATILGVPDGIPVGERSLDDFFAPHVRDSDPGDARAQEMRPRYERLEDVLRATLRDVHVFRIGAVEVRCYIVGTDGRGNLAGLVTTAIET